MILKESVKGSAALLAGTVIWGSAFIAQSLGMDYVGPFTFQACRCTLAVLTLLLLASVMEIRDWKHFWRRWADRRLWLAGIACGSALFVASSLQQVGLVTTDAGKAGFLTAMYIVFVPFFGIFLGRRIRWNAVAAILVAVAGLYMLSCAQVEHIEPGDFLLLLCAAAFAVQITLIDRFAPQVDAVRLNCVQALVVAVLSTGCMLAFEQPSARSAAMAFPAIAYAGILSMGIAYYFQIVGQRRVAPAPAAMLMSLESVFAALFGWLILHENLSGSEKIGCALVFAAVIVSQLPNRVRKKVSV